jgi:hypothetical protein
MRRTIINITSTGAYVVPDPGMTQEIHYDEYILAQAGAIPEVECPEPDTVEHDIIPKAASAIEAAHKAATAEALGAYFDAVLDEGFEWGLAQRMLRMAFAKLTERKRGPAPIIQGLYDAKA